MDGGVRDNGTDRVQPRAFANLVLDLIDSFGCTPTPHAYEVFFAYASKRPAKLRLQVDAAAEPDHVLRTFDLERIHEAFFRTPGGGWAKQDKSAHAIEVTLKEVYALIDAHISSSREHQARLHSASAEIDPTMDAADLHNVAVRLASETDAMIEDQATLNRSLGESQTRLASVRADVRAARDEGQKDVLTGLWNRRGVDQALARAVQAAVANGMQLALCLVDLDRFGQINAKHGQPIGDAVLKCVGRALPAQLGERDIIGRRGGQAFAIVMPGRNASDAFRTIQYLRTYLAERKFFLRGTGVDVGRITASFGIAMLQSCSAADLLDRADEMLQQAKARGGNKVVSDTMPTL